MSRGVLLAVLLAAALLVVGCGDDDDRPGSTPPAGETATATTGDATPEGSPDESPTSDPATQGATPEVDPQALGDTIVIEWTGIMNDELRPLLEGLPPAGEIWPEVSAIKESAISRFVDFGHTRQAFDEVGRAAVDEAARSAAGALDPAEYAWFRDAYAHYETEEPAFAADLDSINVITQYAFFDLLRAQLPEEADRLGLP